MEYLHHYTQLRQDTHDELIVNLKANSTQCKRGSGKNKKPQERDWSMDTEMLASSIAEISKLSIINYHIIFVFIFKQKSLIRQCLHSNKFKRYTLSDRLY